MVQISTVRHSLKFSFQVLKNIRVSKLHLIFCSASILCISQLASSQATLVRTSALSIELAKRMSSSDVRGFQIGVTAIEIDSGRVLATTNEHLPLNPASNAKLITAITALALLHPEHRFETGVYGPSTKESTLNGPLMIRGFGDPSLRTGDIYAMALELKRLGIKKIEGGIFVDQKFYDEQFTPPAFEQQPNEWMPFRAPVAAISLDENIITAHFRPSKGSSALVSFWPPGFVDVEGNVQIKDDGEARVQMTLSASKDDPKRMHAVIRGSIPETIRGVSYTRRVENPSVLVGYALKAALTDLGIELKGNVTLGASSEATTLLARHRSLPLAALLLPVGKESDNFYAEMILKSLAGERKTRPASSQNGTELATQFLSKIGALDAGMVIKNGSGLFDANRTTTHSLASLLRWAYREPSIHPEVLTHLSIGGVDGTLRGRFKSQHSRRAIRAKTGTLDDAIALSGYVLAPPGRSSVAFSILINHCKDHVRQARNFADGFVGAIVKDVWGNNEE